MRKTKEIKKFFKAIWGIVKTIITVILVLVSLIIVTQRVSNNEKAFLGYRIFKVQTGSMIPKYLVGDVLLVKETDVDDLKVGDDVTYVGQDGSFTGMIVTHQIIEIEENDGEILIHTKGIANSKEDPVITPDQINGVVQGKLQLLTTITSLLNNGYIFYFCGIIPITIYAFFAIIKSGEISKKKAKNNNQDKEE